MSGLFWSVESVIPLMDDTLPILRPRESTSELYLVNDFVGNELLPNFPKDEHFELRLANMSICCPISDEFER